MLQINEKEKIQKALVILCILGVLLSINIGTHMSAPDAPPESTDADFPEDSLQATALTSEYQDLESQGLLLQERLTELENMNETDDRQVHKEMLLVEDKIHQIRVQMQQIRARLEELKEMSSQLSD